MKVMESHSPVLQTIVCFASTCLAWVSLQNVQIILACVASIVAAVSGILAGINWWYSIQEKRHNIKNLKTK